MPQLYVRLFGKCSIQRDSCPLTNFDARKVQELFCYLLLRRDHTHSREVVAGLLWGESSNTQAKKCLRQTLWQLQAGLGISSAANDKRLLHIEADWIQVNPQADFWFDIAEFEKAWSLVQGQQGTALQNAAVKALRYAVELYQGDLLEGWYQDWCIYERERLQNIYLAMLDKLMVYCEAQQAYEEGLAYGMRILRYDRAHERTHRRMMSLYYHAGDRAAALRQYQRCQVVLQEELGVSPSHLTTTLYEQIQADQQEDYAPELPGTDFVALAEPLQGFLTDLKQRWYALADLEQRMHADIEALEKVIQEYYLAQRG